LYGLVLRDQMMNIFGLVPGLALFNLAAVFCIYTWPEVLLSQHVHLAFALVQTISLLGYLIYVVRFYGRLAPIVLKANQEESTDQN
jgi:hypothetical protein